MHAPVNQCSSACNCLVCKISAKTWNASECSKAYIDMIYFSELSTVDKVPDFINTCIESVYNTYVKDLVGLLLHLLHFQSFRISSCCRLFAKHMLSCTQHVNGYYRVHVVWSANRYCINGFILCNNLVIRYSLTNPVFFNTFFCSFLYYVAEVYYFCIFAFQICRYMGSMRNSAASDYPHPDLAQIDHSLILDILTEHHNSNLSCILCQL